MSKLWTQERIFTAVKMHKEGYSARRISEKLKCGLSRNAVIGKLLRMGITGGGKIPSKKFKGVPLPPSLPTQPVNGPKPLGAANTFLDSGQCRWIHGDIGKAWQMCGHPISPGSKAWCPYHLNMAKPKPKAVA